MVFLPASKPFSGAQKTFKEERTRCSSVIETMAAKEETT